MNADHLTSIQPAIGRVRRLLDFCILGCVPSPRQSRRLSLLSRREGPAVEAGARVAHSSCRHERDHESAGFERQVIE
jgi:hypothetical protein